VTILVACLSVYLYIIVPKGFFPQQDTGRIMGSVQAAQDISFQAMRDKMERYVSIVSKDPAVSSVVGFAGGNTVSNQGPILHYAETAGGTYRLPESSFLAIMPERHR